MLQSSLAPFFVLSRLRFALYADEWSKRICGGTIGQYSQRWYFSSTTWHITLLISPKLVEWSLTAVLLYQTVDLNFGRHIQLMDRWQHIPFAKVCLIDLVLVQTNMNKSLVATQLLYYCVQAIIKISLLLLYHRLFGVDKLFRTALYVSAALTLMWWLGSFLDTIFQCIPVAASWDNSIKDAKCQSIEDAALGTAIPNLILDILFLLLPVPIIWKLNVDKRVKVSLTGIFLLGALYVLP